MSFARDSRWLHIYIFNETGRKKDATERHYALRSIFSNELLRSLSTIDNLATAEAHYHEVIIAERTAAPVKQV